MVWPQTMERFLIHTDGLTIGVVKPLAGIAGSWSPMSSKARPSVLLESSACSHMARSLDQLLLRVLLWPTPLDKVGVI